MQRNRVIELVYVRELLLRPWEEAVGKLCEFKVSSETASFKLSINSSDIVMQIPVNMIQWDYNRLKKIKGKMIAILRTDKGFYIRETQQFGPSPKKKSI